ncbi:competence protein ComFB [Ectothiorhodospiraceae bacterium BW-2]|nr:competence protein ComFB [Ectothiorhodospiraceae bacterium BW-2]
MNFDEIHNYYEQLVINYLVETAIQEHQLTDSDLIVDVACIALNRLPARYIRHDVDMAFFLTSHERLQMQHRVIQEIKTAITQVKARHAEDDLV